MRNLLLILMLFMSQIGLSQIRLNSSKTEILSEFSEPKYSLKQMNLDGINAISIITDRVNLLYLFNPEGLCKICFLIPETQDDLNYYVEKHNQKYVVISNTKWKMYNDNGIAEIELIFNNNKPAFKWTTN